MGRFWKRLRNSLLLLPFLAFAESPHGIELRVVEQEYLPGDVIRIHAEMSRSDYAEFTLHVPSHPYLHFVAHTQHPLKYANGEYTQASILLLQTMTSGDFELASITAEIKKGEDLQHVELPPLSFSVQSYATVDESKELENLTLDSPEKNNGATALWITLLVAALSYALFWKFIRKPVSTTLEAAQQEESLDDLEAQLEQGESPIDLIERLLLRTQLSPELRRAMEAAAYANRLDKDELINLLKKEASK